MQQHGGVTLSNCTDITKGNGFPEAKKSEEEQTYTLPSWRVNEIIFFAVQFLSNAGFWEEGFDYQKVIMSEGIVIKAYSAFKSENLLELQKVSLSVWDEGLCFVTTDKESNRVCRMIAYNDAKTAAEIMQIIFHEYAHIRFCHTQQSLHGEAEAILFSAIATFLMIAEKQFHLGALIAKEGGKEAFLDGMKSSLMERHGSREVA